MSIHSSLRGIDTLIGERSVLSRTERINVLIKQGKLNPATGSVFRLPKVRTRFKIAGVKKVPKPAAGEPGAAVAAPVAEAKPEAAKGKESGKKK